MFINRIFIAFLLLVCRRAFAEWGSFFDLRSMHTMTLVLMMQSAVFLLLKTFPGASGDGDIRAWFLWLIILFPCFLFAICWCSNTYCFIFTSMTTCESISVFADNCIRQVLQISGVFSFFWGSFVIAVNWIWKASILATQDPLWKVVNSACQKRRAHTFGAFLTILNEEWKHFFGTFFVLSKHIVIVLLKVRQILGLHLLAKPRLFFCVVSRAQLAQAIIALFRRVLLLFLSNQVVCREVLLSKNHHVVSRKRTRSSMWPPIQKVLCAAFPRIRPPYRPFIIIFLASHTVL